MLYVPIPALRDNRWSQFARVELFGEKVEPGRTAKIAEERQERGEQCSAGLRRRSAYTCGALILILVVWRSSAFFGVLGDFILTMPASGIHVEEALFTTTVSPEMVWRSAHGRHFGWQID